MLRKQTLKPNQNLNENYLQILKCLVCPLLSLDLKLPDASLSNDDLFILKSKLSKMSLILASSNKLFDSCFSNSATLFLKHQKLALNLSQIILLFASIVSSQLSKESSIDSDIDHLIIRVTELFISQIRSTLLESKTSISADILTRRESWIAIIAPLLKSRIETDASLPNILRVIFEFPKAQHYLLLEKAKKNGNEKYLFIELKLQMDIIAKDSKIQFLPLDFPSSEAYQQWKRSELAILQGFYQSLVARFGAPTINSIQIDDSMIPQDPQNVYNELQIKCLEYNLRNSKENKLSKSCIQILAECAIRWGVCKRYRDISLLDVMIEKYRAHFLALNDIQQQVSIVVKTCCDYKINSKFTTIFAQTTLSKLFNLLSNNIINFYRDNEITDVKIQTSIKIIESIAPLLEINNLNETLNEYISEGVNLRYMELNNQTNDSVEITRLLNLTRALNNQVSKYGVVYSGLGLDVKLIAAEIFLKYLILELGNINTGDDYTIKEVLDLYQSTKMLYQVCEAAKSSISMPPNDFNVENWFHPFIISYLELADLRCLEWVKPAVLVDDFKPCYPPFTMSSTSVLDIFMSFHQGIDFIENFAWRESGRREMLAKKFVSTLSKSLKEYCTLLFQDFKELQKSTTPRVLFPTKLLVEINNLIESRTKLLEILSKLGVNYDSFDEYAKHTEPDSTQATFRITIIRASGLESYSKDWTSLDPYLVLKHKNVELMRTSTIQKSKNPIWAQSFTINLSNDMPDSECFLDLVIYDKELLKDAETAKTSLFMRDILYSDFLSHKIKKQLSPKGRIELLVCKIGEIESVGWYVKNTEQAIDATIDDMVSVLIDDIAKSFTRSISHISEGSLMSLFSSSGTASDDKIEKQMTPFLEYLDSCLGLFNEYLDPRLNEFMLDRHAWISTLAAVTGKNAVYVLATMVWIQLLREMTLFVFKNKKKENKELIKSICDILKIVFYCNGLGIPLVELENEFYSDLKRLLKM